MKAFSKILLAGVAAVSMAMGTAKAAVLNFTAAVGATSDFNATTNTVTTGPFDLTQTNKSYRIDFTMSVTGLVSPEVGFGNFAFDVNLAGGSQRNTVAARANYVANNPSNIDLFGDGSQFVSPFATDADKGSSTTDLKAILLDMGAGLDHSDPRLATGNPTPYRVGSVWVSIPAGAEGTVVPSITPGSVTWSTSNSSGGPTQTVGTNYQVAGLNTITLGAIPEPTSLAGLALAGLLAMRRRHA